MADANGWNIDTSDIKKLGPIREWNRKAQTGDMEGLIGIMARRIKSWPYADIDPADTEAYDELEPEQWTEALQRVGASFNAVFQRKNGKRK